MIKLFTRPFISSFPWYSNIFSSNHFEVFLILHHSNSSLRKINNSTLNVSYKHQQFNFQEIFFLVFQELTLKLNLFFAKYFASIQLIIKLIFLINNQWFTQAPIILFPRHGFSCHADLTKNDSESKYLFKCHDTQHNDIQHNYTQHNGSQWCRVLQLSQLSWVSLWWMSWRLFCLFSFFDVFFSLQINFPLNKSIISTIHAPCFMQQWWWYIWDIVTSSSS